MATLSLRMRDDLKKKAQQLASEQGVSLNGFINATLAAAIAQEETLTFFSDRLQDVDQETLHEMTRPESSCANFDPPRQRAQRRGNRTSRARLTEGGRL
jgi:antitoxin component of RelBE/YafQ-DinJ toxin-antitoxin module